MIPYNDASLARLAGPGDFVPPAHSDTHDGDTRQRAAISRPVVICSSAISDRRPRVYTPNMFAMIILCVAVLCLAVMHAPPPAWQPVQWIAVGLTVLALLAVCLRWSPIG